jgi:DUF971 family protein
VKGPGSDDVVPDEVGLDPEARALEILWSDGRRSRHSFDDLRRLCPCAGCRERPAPAAGALHVLAPKERRAMAADVVNVTPVGRYAINLRFSDGHASGIYTFDFLREMAEAGGMKDPV